MAMVDLAIVFGLELVDEVDSRYKLEVEFGWLGTSSTFKGRRGSRGGVGARRSLSVFDGCSIIGEGLR